MMCAPATPSFDENAFDELTRETKTDVEEWGYPTAAGVEVHATAKPNSSVIEKLGMNLVRVLDSDKSNGADAPLKVVTPAGRAGLWRLGRAGCARVRPTLLLQGKRKLEDRRLRGRRHLTQGARSPQRLSTHDGWTMRGPKMKQSSLPTNRSERSWTRGIRRQRLAPTAKKSLLIPTKLLVPEHYPHQDQQRTAQQANGISSALFGSSREASFPL